MGSSARGLRVNNPLNIRKSGEIFKGEKLPSPDDSFKAFKGQDYGYRAAAVILYTYFKKYNLDTIRKMISRYAPPSDGNDTEGYIETVTSRMGTAADRVITLADFQYPESDPYMKRLIEHMAVIETGQMPDGAMSKAGYDMFINDRL